MFRACRQAQNGMVRDQVAVRSLTVVGRFDNGKRASAGPILRHGSDVESVSRSIENAGDGAVLFVSNGSEISWIVAGVRAWTPGSIRIVYGKDVVGVGDAVDVAAGFGAAVDFAGAVVREAQYIRVFSLWIHA